jgi:hypothetical protein
MGGIANDVSQTNFSQTKRWDEAAAAIGEFPFMLLFKILEGAVPMRLAYNISAKNCVKYDFCSSPTCWGISGAAEWPM